MNTKNYQIEISIKLHSSKGKTPEGYMQLNEQTVDLSESIRAWAKFGHNQLSITLLNKSANDTVVDDNHQLIEDLAVEVTAVLVEKIDITDIFKEQCRLVCGTEQEQTYGYIHKNGVLKFDFVCPIFYYVRNVDILSVGATAQ